MFAGDENEILYWDAFGDHLQEEFVPEMPDAKSEELLNQCISTDNRCSTKEARELAISNLHDKQNIEQHCNIGGCYTDNAPDLWFYYTTTSCPEQAYLLNLFVHHRNVGSFAIGISNSNEFTTTESKVAQLPQTLKWFQFNSTKKDESHYIKTFNFNEKQWNNLTGKLIIPVRINLDAPFTLSDDIIRAIKDKHNSTIVLLAPENKDFTLISANGRKFPVHKIVVASQSGAVKCLVKESQTSAVIDLEDKELEFLVKYIYKCAEYDLQQYDVYKLLKIVTKFEMIHLGNLITKHIVEQVNVDNAVDIAMTAKKHNLDALSTKIFNFIKNNPEVMDTNGWKNLNDIELAKSLFQYFQTGN